MAGLARPATRPKRVVFLNFHQKPTHTMHQQPVAKWLCFDNHRFIAVEEVGMEKSDPIIREIIELERRYFFEKRNVKTERQRKLQEIIERHTKMEVITDDT
ncbi:MAG: hypothetical protein GXP03_14760 [Alphaproteobacteria bacterium]|nr:hypothetical protein [Alphaproteobacteria bacterium]